MESDTIATDETVVRQALKELTENIVVAPPTNNANNILGNGKPPGPKIIEHNSSGGGDFISNEDLENLNTSTKSVGGVVKSSAEGDFENRTNFGKTEISSSKEKVPAANPVLPDIVNVQPHVAHTEADKDDSLILALASNLTGLQIGTPKGQSRLPPSQLAAAPLTAPNTLAPSHNCDALSAVSSDDEIFSECQAFTDGTTMDGKGDDVNQSINWENVISSVTYGCADSIDNTLEQIESATEDLRTDVQLETGTGNGTFIEPGDDAVTSTDANLNPIIAIESPNVSSNPEITIDDYCNIEKSPSMSPAELKSPEANTNCMDEKSVPEIHIEPATPRPSTSPPIRIIPPTPRTSTSPQRSENLDGTFEANSCPFDNEQIASPGMDVNTTFPSASVQAEPLDTTIDIKTDSPAAEAPKQAFVVAENLNGTFEAAPSNIMNSPDDFVSKTKEHKCNENELKAALTTNYDPPEAMDVDETWSEENIVAQFNSTGIVSNGNTPLKSSPKKQDVFVENLIMDQIDVTFKAPVGPPPQVTNKRKSMENMMEPGDDEFSNGLILNPSDFDFLLSKGNSNVTVDRDSLLLKFDPLLNRAVAVDPQQQQQQQQQQVSIPGARKAHNGTVSGPHFEPTLIPVEEKESNCSSNSLNEQFALDSDFSRSVNSTIPVGGSYEEVSNQSNSRVDINVSETDSNLVSANSSPEFHENPKTLKDRINRRQPEEKKSNAKMSVDVIQDMKIDTDTKCIDNINSETDEKQDYKMAELEKKIKNETLKNEDVEKKLKDAEQREEALLKRITDKDRTIAKMSGVLEQYEKAIAELIAEKEQIKQNYEKQLDEIKADRDLNYQHLTSLETTFSDLHAKYERSKSVTATLKANEESLASERKQNLENLRLQELRYDKMKNHAMQQLEIANNKLETLSKSHSVEITKLKALLKKEEISRLSVTEQLVQKTRENEELVKICDELINGQGTS